MLSIKSLEKALFEQENTEEIDGVIIDTHDKERAIRDEARRFATEINDPNSNYSEVQKYLPYMLGSFKQELRRTDFYRGFYPFMIKETKKIVFEELSIFLREKMPIPKNQRSNYNNPFEGVPDKAINSWMNEVRLHNMGIDRSAFGVELPSHTFTLEKETQDSFATGVGIAKIEDESKLYFKIHANEEDAIRESLSFWHRLGTFMTFNYTPNLGLNNIKGYSTHQGFHFTLYTDAEYNESYKPLIEKFEGLFEFTLQQKFPRTSFEDHFARRMYILAVFHAEMLDTYIPEEHRNLFSPEDFKEVSDLRESLEDKSIITNDVVRKYEDIKARHGKLPKTFFTHGDTKKDNWKSNENSEYLLDFNRVGFRGAPYVDVERALMDAPFKKRADYRNMYLHLLESASVLLGVNIPELPEINFQKGCIERGFTDSLKLMSWYSKNKSPEKANHYRDNFELYNASVQ